jgi:hypothetical protein
MKCRSGGGPECAAAGQQRAHDDDDPVERRVRRNLRGAAQLHAAELREGDRETDREGREHQHLPVEAEDARRPAEGGIDDRREPREVAQRRHQEQHEEAAADEKNGPVDAARMNFPLIASGRKRGRGIYFHVSSSSNSSLVRCSLVQRTAR